MEKQLRKLKSNNSKGRQEEEQAKGGLCYLYFQSVDPDTGIPNKVMSVMSIMYSFINDIFKRIAVKTSRLLHYQLSNLNGYSSLSE